MVGVNGGEDGGGVIVRVLQNSVRPQLVRLLCSFFRLPTIHPFSIVAGGCLSRAPLSEGERRASEPLVAGPHGKTRKDHRPKINLKFPICFTRMYLNRVRNPRRSHAHAGWGNQTHNLLAVTRRHFCFL